MAVTVELLYGHTVFFFVFFFSKIAVYFKLNHFKLIHLQANVLSSPFSLILQSIILICLKKFIRAWTTQDSGQSQGGCHILHPQQWWYSNLTNYELSCKIIVQLSRNSSYKPGTDLSGFFLV